MKLGPKRPAIGVIRYDQPKPISDSGMWPRESTHPSVWKNVSSPPW
jgi:hypothetical protein